MGADRFQREVLAPLFDKSDPPARDEPDAARIRRETASALRSRVALVCLWGFVLGLTAPVWNRVARWVLWLAQAASRGVEWILRRLGWQLRNPRLAFIERLNRRAITDDLERLLYETMVHGELIQVSLDNNKVYVGIVRSVDPVGPAKHFTMQPFMSGGRDAADRDVRYTSFYDRVIRTVTASEPARRAELLRRFQIVVPLARIVTASGFDMAAYREFEAARPIKKSEVRVGWLAALGRAVSALGRP